MVVLFHVKFADCKIDVAAFPINNWFAVKVATPKPPRDIGNVPDAALETFNAVKPAPAPTKLVADKVFVVLSHDKFADCKIDVAAFPIKIWFAVNVVTPIPPRAIDNVPDAALETFNELYQHQNQ